MKIKELNLFEADIRKEFCNYLKKYFKEDCEVKWVFDDRILIGIDFEATYEKEHTYVMISDRGIYKICLNGLESNIGILDFKKYIDKFLNEECKKKDYINTEDFKKICALYDSLDLKYKKDDIREFYDKIASVLSKDCEPYILDDNKIFAYSYGVHAKQDIYNDKNGLAFIVRVCNDEKDAKVALGVNCEQINILTLAEGLVNIQKKLEEIIK